MPKLIPALAFLILAFAGSLTEASAATRIARMTVGMTILPRPSAPAAALPARAPTSTATPAAGAYGSAPKVRYPFPPGYTVNVGYQ